MRLGEPQLPLVLEHNGSGVGVGEDLPQREFDLGLGEAAELHTGGDHPWERPVVEKQSGAQKHEPNTQYDHCSCAGQTRRKPHQDQP